MSRKYNRREAIKTLGLSVGAAALGISAVKHAHDNIIEYPLDYDRVYQPVPNSAGKPITAITCGAGSRGNTYGNYAANFPDQIKIIGVAEPVKFRIDRYSKKHNIPESNQFVTWEHVFERPKFADAIIITMPDHLHYEPCLRALDMGYDVLLEKPMAQTADQCRDILARVNKTGRIVAICHVLRYAPYFIKMRNLLNEGAVGELVSIQHMEPIEHIHMSHSFVRGNWHNSVASTPIILAKSCHDLDILRWLIGKNCRQVAAMGSLSWFRREHAPAGSTARCMDGCALEKDCPYSALDLYYRKRSWTYVFDLPDDKEKHADAILEYLRTTNYGRCVYRMENDQCDHYVASMLFDGNITANFSMEAFTAYAGRRTRIMGAMGDMSGDMEELVLNDFRTGKTTKMVPKAEDVDNYKNSGHGGGDWVLMHDFINAVVNHDPGLLTSTVEQSIESHIMGFAAEVSRRKKKVVNVKV